MAKYMTKREAVRKRAWFRAISGLMDFFASIGSVFIILLCVALITQLFIWLRGDITQTLFSLESVMVSAIVQPSSMADTNEVDINSISSVVPASEDVAVIEPES